MRRRTRAVESSRGTRGRKRSARSPAAKSPSDTNPLLGLQSTAGNAAVSSLVQRKEEDSEAGVPGTKQESSDLYERATAALDAGRYAEAQPLYERLLAGGYRHREALHTLVWNLAICKANLGDFDGAYELAITYGHYGGGRADEQRLLERVEQVRAANTGDASGAPIPRTKKAAGELFERASAALAGSD
jgi:tetratricopeptide (TPR) repeat protein